MVLVVFDVDHNSNCNRSVDESYAAVMPTRGNLAPNLPWRGRDERKFTELLKHAVVGLIKSPRYVLFKMLFISNVPGTTTWRQYR